MCLVWLPCGDRRDRPTALPANVGTVLYMQLRMVAAIAYLGGYDPKDNAVRTMAYLCLVGQDAKDIIQQVDPTAGGTGLEGLRQLPDELLAQINREVARRLITKVGTTGALGVLRVVPILGGFVGAGFDSSATRWISEQAIEVFIRTPHLGGAQTTEAKSEN